MQALTSIKQPACLPTIHREERDQRRNDIEHLATSLVGKVNECVAALDEGRSPASNEDKACSVA